MQMIVLFGMGPEFAGHGTAVHTSISVGSITGALQYGKIVGRGPVPGEIPNLFPEIQLNHHLCFPKIKLPTVDG